MCTCFKNCVHKKFRMSYNIWRHSIMWTLLNKPTIYFFRPVSDPGNCAWVRALHFAFVAVWQPPRCMWSVARLIDIDMAAWWPRGLFCVLRQSDAIFWLSLWPTCDTRTWFCAFSLTRAMTAEADHGRPSPKWRNNLETTSKRREKSAIWKCFVKATSLMAQCMTCSA